MIHHRVRRNSIHRHHEMSVSNELMLPWDEDECHRHYWSVIISSLNHAEHRETCRDEFWDNYQEGDEKNRTIDNKQLSEV